MYDIILCKKGLAKRFLSANLMSSFNEVLTPIKLLAPLGLDPYGTPPKYDWSDASAIVMLIYLVDNYIPDIYSAAHQYALCIYNNITYHEKSVKFICGYLQRTGI